MSLDTSSRQMGALSQSISRSELAQGAVCNIDKPAGWTSFDVVNKLRGVTRVKRVGHAGTLDPFATGVLLICFAGATKRVEQLMGLEKEYEGVIELGTETDSHDIQGKVVANRPIPHLTQAEVEKSLKRYHGAITQIPPSYSALKRQGQRLYDLARRGEAVELEPRPITIYEIELLGMSLPEIRIRLVCSRGTYVRALARDLGRDFGCGAYLKVLRRTRVGSFLAKDALQIEPFIERLTD